MDYIYTRVSTEHQTTENQTKILISSYPTASIVEETGSGVKTRPKLNELLGKLVKGDRLVVYALDRLGRSLTDLITIITNLTKQGVAVVSHREGTIDPSTAMGAFTMNIMSALAQMERDILIERTKAGLDRARGAGVKLGRATSISEDTRLRIKNLKRQGVSYRNIAKTCGVSVGTISKIMQGVT